MITTKKLQNLNTINDYKCKELLDEINIPYEKVNITPEIFSQFQHSVKSLNKSLNKLNKMINHYNKNVNKMYNRLHSLKSLVNDRMLKLDEVQDAIISTDEELEKRKTEDLKVIEHV